LVLLPILAFAQSEDTPTTKCHFEANMAALSLRQGRSPLVGPSAVFRASEKFSLGVRTLMSLNGTADESIASLNLLQRYHFNSTTTSLFIEFSEAYNQVNRRRYFPSIGTALGLSHQVGNYFSVGGLGGFEADLDQNGDTLVYPKVLASIAVKM
jgi:hypothetical protein